MIYVYIINPLQNTSTSLVPLSLHHTCLDNSNSRWSWVSPFSEHKPKLTLYNYKKKKNHTITLHFKFITAQQCYYNPFQLFRNNFIFWAFQVPPFQLMISYLISLRLQNFLMLLLPKLQNYGYLYLNSPPSSPITIKKVSLSLSKFSPFTCTLDPISSYLIKGFTSSVRSPFPKLSISHKLLVIM